MDFSNHYLINEKKAFIKVLITIATIELLLGLGFLFVVVKNEAKYLSLLLFLIIPYLIIKYRKYDQIQVKLIEKKLDIGMINGKISVDIKNLKGVNVYTGTIKKGFYWKKPFVQENMIFSILAKKDMFLISLKQNVHLNLKGKIYSIDGIVTNLQNHDRLIQIFKTFSQKIKSPRNRGDAFNQEIKTNSIIIRAKNIKKSYSNVNFMDIETFHLHEGEICGLIGENGAGKTTLIKILMTLIKKDSGHIEYFNKEINLIKEISHKIGYVPDIPVFYEKFTVINYLIFLGHVYNLDSDIFQEKMNYYIDFFKMENRKHAYIFNLSLGQKKKLSIISALLHDPQLLIMDEPLIGLDPGSQWDLLKLLQNLNKKAKTILISSHTLEILEKACSRIIILKDGQILFSETPNKLKIQTSQNTLLKAYLKLLH